MYAKAITICVLFFGSSLAAAEKITYEDHIKEIFQNSCSNCHKPSKKKGGLNLMIYSDVLKGGSSGKCVESGDVDSLLVKCVTHEEEPIMPPKGPKLSDKEIDLIRQWVAGGLLENTKSKRVKSANNNVAMAMPAIPKGQVIMPEYLNIEPFIKTKKANAVTAMAVSPYSPLIAVGGYKQVLLYNTDNMDLAGVLPYEEGQIYDVKFSRDGSIVLAAGGINGKTGNVVLWNVKSGKRLTELSPDFDTTLNADISSDRKYLATGSSDKLVKIFSLQTGDLIHSIKQHSEWVTNVSISPDGVLVASGDRNGHIYVWEVESGQKLYTMMHHKKDITSLSWRADSNLLAASSEDGEVSTWNIINGRKAKNFRAHSNGTTDVFYSNKGHLVTCGRDQHAKVYDGNYKQIKAIKLKSNLPLKAVATSEVNEVLCSDWRGQIHKWDLKTNKIVGLTQSNPGSIPEQIIAFEQEIQSSGEKIGALEKKIAEQQKNIDWYNKLKQKPNKLRNDIKKLNSEIQKLTQQLKTEKDKAKRDALAKNIADKKKAIPQLTKQIKTAEQEVQKRKKNVQYHYKVKAEADQDLKRVKSFIETLKVRIVRYEAEKINTERHKLLAEISKLKIDIENSKYTVEDLQAQIKSSGQTIQKLTDLDDKIESEMSDNEALDTLVKRYEKIQQLKQHIVDSELKIKETIANEPKLKALLPPLEAKEKQLLESYLSQLPKTQKPTQAAK